jgi:uncharacterized integral membrane protein (TIGR00698 family)
MKNIPGILLCTVIGAVSIYLAKIIPIGAVTIAILLGCLIANIFNLPKKTSVGAAFSEKIFLPTAIALMGLSLNYSVLASLGLLTIFLIISAIIVTISTSVFIGRKFGVNKDLCLLIGIGNAVCGSSAIGAAQAVIKTDERNVGLSVAVINLLGTLGIFLLPALCRFVLNFSNIKSGLLLGTGLQAIGQVTAAGFSIGNDTGEIAVIVKMCRILMITPLVLFLNLKKGAASEEGIKLPRIPAFIIIFILLSVVGSTEFIPQSHLTILKSFSKIFLITAMSAIGMKITFRDIASGGKTALKLGITSWACQISFICLMIIIFWR